MTIWNRIDELDEASKTRELTAEEQTMMIDALKEACDWFQSQQDQQVIDLTATLTEKGVTFTPTGTP